MIAQVNVKHTKGNNDFDFQCKIQEGIVGVYGSSGAGKTTFLNLLSGLETPLEGSIELKGFLVYDSKTKHNISEIHRGIGYVFQDGRLFPHLNVKQNLCYSKPYTKKKDKNIPFDDVVELLEIQSLLKKMPRQLSGGELQRVAIGRALLSQPSLLLLDEPFSNLDRYLRKQIISYLIKINQRFSIPMLIVSHVIGDILRLTNQMIVIDKRKIVASGDIFSLMTENVVPEIIKPRRYLNIYNADLSKFDEQEKLYIFQHEQNKEVKFATSSKIASNLTINSKIRFAIRPDDIALGKNEIKDSHQ